MASAAAEIHPTAIVSPSAKLGAGTVVGPYSIVGPDVVLGDNNRIGPHVVLDGHTKIGNGNTIYQFASVGAAPQDLKYKGEPSELIIGNGNIMRECCTLQPGTAGGGMITRVGDENLFMANAHVGHDSIVGNRCVFANSAALAGHVTIGNGVIVGGLSGIHQFVRIGDVAMIGAGAMVAQDIPPFCMAQGDRATVQGLNRIGLERSGCSKEEFAVIREVYRMVFTSSAPEVKGKVFRDRVSFARGVAARSANATAFLDFLQSSERGIAAHHSQGAE